MACPVVELLRFNPLSGDKGRRGIQGAFTGGQKPATLLVYNPLSAPVFIRLGAGDPTAANHDVACPGSAILAWPIPPDLDAIGAVIVYPGAVPAGDLAQVIIRATSAQLPAFVGPVN